MASRRSGTQEQAVAAWVGYLNQLRIDTMLHAFSQQHQNLRDALASIDGALSTIDQRVVAPNLGGQKGMHGFIAEVAQVGVGNARQQILGEDASWNWVHGFGPVDLIHGGIPFQQKFVASGGKFSLGAVAQHLDKYPDYLANGGKYQIPKDHYATIQQLRALSPEEAAATLSRAGDGPSLAQWKWVQKFFGEGAIGIESIEPSDLGYAEVQRGTYEATLAAEKDALQGTHEAQREHAYQQSRPTLREGAQAAAGAAAVEGGTAFVLAVSARLRDGTRIRDLTGDDWAGILIETGSGTARGAVRGVSLYSLTNLTATSAAVASAVVTAAFGIAEQAHRFRTGEIQEQEFIENAERVALDAAVSALAAFLGQVLIPVPILGAVIGNAVGTVLQRAAASALSRREIALLERYAAEQRALDARLAAEHRELLEQLDAATSHYLALLERAFAPDIAVALEGSVALARQLGVPAAAVLATPEQARAYFTG